jgi:hypothetical protein
MKAALRAHQRRDPSAVKGDDAQQERRDRDVDPVGECAERIRSGRRRPREGCCPTPIPHAQSSVCPRRLSRSPRCRSLAATLHDAVEKIHARAVSPCCARQIRRPCDSPLFRGVSRWSYRGSGAPENGGSPCRAFRAGSEGNPCATGRGAPVSADDPCYLRPGLGGVTTVSRFLPFARRLFSTSLPPGVAIRARKP